MMETEIKYYLVRLVNLKSCKFIEMEMPEAQLNAVDLVNEIKGEYLQVLSKEHVKTKYLESGIVLDVQ